MRLYAQQIERWIEERTASRSEWHALRRHRHWQSVKSALAIDVLLMPVVLNGRWRRASQKLLKNPAWRALMAASGAQSTIPAMEGSHPHDMETLADAIEPEVAMAQPAFGTFLPQLVVDAQLELAALSPQELAARFGHLVYAMTLRHGPACTPRKLLTEFAEKAVSDANWWERTGPELRKVLRAHGVDLQMIDRDGEAFVEEEIADGQSAPQS